MRRLVAFVMCVAPFTVIALDSPVMLDNPGTWEAIQKEDPVKHKQLVAILTAAEKYGCGADLPKELRAQFGVTGARCTGYPMMTEPQKAGLTFKLGDTQYSTTWVPSRGQNRNAN